MYISIVTACVHAHVFSPARCPHPLHCTAVCADRHIPNHALSGEKSGGRGGLAPLTPRCNAYGTWLGVWEKQPTSSSLLYNALIVQWHIVDREFVSDCIAATIRIPNSVERTIICWATSSPVMDLARSFSSQMHCFSSRSSVR